MENNQEKPMHPQPSSVSISFEFPGGAVAKHHFPLIRNTVITKDGGTFADEFMKLFSSATDTPKQDNLRFYLEFEAHRTSEKNGGVLGTVNIEEPY